MGKGKKLAIETHKKTKELTSEEKLEYLECRVALIDKELAND